MAISFTRKTQDPEERANPLQVALDNYNTMERELILVRDELESYRSRCDHLEAQNASLSEELAQVKRERSYLQAYCVNITTRLDVIQESIAAAKSEALKFSVRQGPPPEPEESEAGDGAEALIRQLGQIGQPSCHPLGE